MQITIDATISPAQAQLAAVNARLDSALNVAMKEANGLLLQQVRDYPPPPDPIQGPANVPVRTFQATYRRADGSTYRRAVRVRANKAAGRGITLQKARDLRYKRTNTLYRSWQPVLRGEGTELVGGVLSSGNMTRTSNGDSYNRYVQDAAYQARIHQGRWDTVQEIGRRSESQVQAIFEARIRSIGG